MVVYVRHGYVAGNVNKKYNRGVPKEDIGGNISSALLFSKQTFSFEVIDRGY